MKVSRHLPVAVALCTLAGCNAIFGLREVSLPPPPDARPDAPPCGMPSISDTFDTTPACASWGHSFAASSTVGIENGELVIRPAAGVASSNAGCSSGGQSSFDPDTGLFVEVPALPDGQEYMLLIAVWPDMTTQTILSWSSSSVGLQQGGTTTTPLGEVAFDPVQTRWARLHARRDGSAIDAETSANGLDWKVFGSVLVAPPPTMGVDLVGGVFAPEPAPAPIRFASLNTCP